MSGIIEFEPTEYARAVDQGFTADLALVRGLFTADDIEGLWPRIDGRPSRLILNPISRRIIGVNITGLKESRKKVGEWVNENVGVRGRIASRASLQSPVMYRRGGMEPHLDARPIVTATTVTLDEIEGKPTTIHAERIADATAPYDEIMKIHQRRQELGILPQFSAELGLGDAAVMGRGVEHAVEASYARRCLLLASYVPLL